MSEKQIKKLIRSLADEKVPGETIDLWPAISKHLQNPEGRPRRNWRSRLRIAGAALGLAVLLTGVVFFLTPQGQAWAQDTFQFFTKAESDRKKVSDFEPSPTSTSSSAAEQGTPTSGVADPTPDQASQMTEGITIEEVQALAGYEIYQPIWLPEDFSFTGAFFYEEKNSVRLIYHHGSDVFDFWQEPVSSDEPTDLYLTVGASADIDEVSINGIYGEYVEGVWQLEGGVGSWINDLYRKLLVWQADGMAYKIDYTGFPAYMRKKDLIAVAESVPTSQADQLLDDLTIEEVQELAGYEVYQPTWLPENFSFQKALYDNETNMVTLMYYRRNNVANAFGLKQVPVSSSGPCEICGFVGGNAHIQEVSVNDNYGEYVEGVWQLVEEDGVWTDEAEWINTQYMKQMQWQEDGMAYELMYMGMPGYMMKSDMIAVAESVLNIVSEVDSVINGLSIGEVEAMTGVDVYEPTWLPEGYAFSEATFAEDTGIVTLMYLHHGNVNNAVSLRQEPATSEPCDICRLVGTSALVENVSISGNDGEYVEGVWTAEDGVIEWKSDSYHSMSKHVMWQADEMMFELNYTGTYLTMNTLIEIAESIEKVP